jgi:Lsr2
MTDDEQAPVSVVSTSSVETIRFALDGTRYEIDLDPPRAAALRTLLARYVTAGRATRHARVRAADRSPGGDAR